LAMMTPFYHPYARLLMPLHALGWVLMGGAFALMQRAFDWASRKSGRAILGMPRPWIRFAAACGLVPIVVGFMGVDYSAEARLGRVVEPSDSLRNACREMLIDLPEDLASLRLYARPPATFYLGGVVPVAPQPRSDDLFATSDPKARALLDAIMVRRGGGQSDEPGHWTDRWELVHEIPTTLNWPTLLDIEPSAATDRSPVRSAPLMLFRPKPPGAAR
jgi:dolichyl-phosphate-mannose-protein mannosyltransferase